MHHPNFDLPFHVYFDASLCGIGGQLLQMHGDEPKPAAYCAGRLQPAEINYITTEQEFLAMVYCFQSWRCYLEGSEVIAHTDHEPLTWLSRQPHLNRRQARWMEFLSRFTYVLLYIKGDENFCADALSRMLSQPLQEPAVLPGGAWPHSQPISSPHPVLFCSLTSSRSRLAVSPGQLQSGRIGSTSCHDAVRGECRTARRVQARLGSCCTAGDGFNPQTAPKEQVTNLVTFHHTLPSLSLLPTFHARPFSMDSSPSSIEASSADQLATQLATIQLGPSPRPSAPPPDGPSSPPVGSPEPVQPVRPAAVGRPAPLGSGVPGVVPQVCSQQS
jgi:hypothetical protein